MLEYRPGEQIEHRPKSIAPAVAFKSNKLKALEACEPIATDNQMIVDGDIQGFTEGNDLSGHLDIGL